MSTISYMTSVNILVILALFATSSFAQVPILINAEYGIQRPIEGAWEFGCENDDPGNPHETDENEFLIFRGDTVEGLVLQYTSTDGTCSGSASTLASDTGDVVIVGESQTLGWLDDGFPVPPPTRQDSSGPLNPTPIATALEYVLPGGEIEPALFYMDDTAEPWCLYRKAGEDSLPSEYMSPSEPLCKVDIVIDPLPVCDIQLDKTTYIGGDTITADVLRLTNPTSAPLALEVKMWVGQPSLPPLHVLNLGADGNFILPEGTDIDSGPIPLVFIGADPLPGEYELSCRMLDPVTGELLVEDRNLFEIE